MTRIPYEACKTAILESKDVDSTFIREIDKLSPEEIQKLQLLMSALSISKLRDIDYNICKLHPSPE